MATIAFQLLLFKLNSNASLPVLVPLMCALWLLSYWYTIDASSS